MKLLNSLILILMLITLYWNLKLRNKFSNDMVLIYPKKENKFKKYYKRNLMGILMKL